MLVHAPEEFYCPECGHTVITERQIKTLDSYSTQSEVLFWGSAGILLVWTIGGLIVTASMGSRFNLGFGFLLLFAVPGAYLALLIYGERRLPATLLVAVLTILLTFGFTMESREDIELRRQNTQLSLDDARYYRELEARETQTKAEEKERERSAESLEKAGNAALGILGPEASPQPPPQETPISIKEARSETFTTVAEAQKAAVERYPDLGVAGSSLNVEFVSRYKLYQQTSPDFFNDVSWPVRLAEELDQKSESK